MISETVVLLEHIMANRSDKTRIFLRSSLDYCKRFATVNHPTLTSGLRKYLQCWLSSTQDSLLEKEYIMIGNLWPSTSEEAKTLAKSLTRISDAELQGLLNGMKNYLA
jgi:DNA-directed RNA polymerase subunit F